MKILQVISEAYGRRFHSYHDELQQYDRDQGRAMHQGRGEIDDESNLMYIYKDGRLKQRMVDNHEERSAKAQGFRDTQEAALKLHGIIRSKFNPHKWVQKQGTQWVEVYPFGNNEQDIKENATAGATNAANVGTVVNPHHSPGKARGKKSYIGDPWGGKSGTKSPAQPKVVQPKNSDGTAKNGADAPNLFGGGAVKRR